MCQFPFSSSDLSAHPLRFDLTSEIIFASRASSLNSFLKLHFVVRCFTCTSLSCLFDMHFHTASRTSVCLFEPHVCVYVCVCVHPDLLWLSFPLLSFSGIHDLLKNQKHVNKTKQGHLSFILGANSLASGFMSQCLSEFHLKAITDLAVIFLQEIRQS